MKLSVGVLFTGSLLWDPEKKRPEWRDDRLALADQHDVRVPIRYGRLSSERGYYTMIIDPE